MGDRESLREQQKRLARERILEAAAQQIAAHGLADLSVPSVAEAAGVSLRTVYNYFETKEALVDGIGVLVEERFDQMGVIDVERDLGRVAEAIRINWPAFGRLGTLGDAWAVVRASRALSEGRSSFGTANDGFNAAIRAALAEEFSEQLTAGQREALFAVLRGVVSSESFYRMRQLGIEAEDAAEVTSWAYEVLRQAMSSGNLPFTDGERVLS